MIKQGGLYWLQPPANDDIPHPHVIIQDDALNNSRLQTVVVCALTSNLKRVSMPGNVLLEAGEGNLPKQSVVEVGKVTTIDKSHLGEYIGSLSAERVAQILAGMRFIERL
jgi:mRNA interferase MazF